MGDYRGGSMIGGLPVVTGKAKENTIPRFVNNSIADSSIMDNGTQVTVSKQLVSTVASGTPPFVLTSPTTIPNLGADTVDGYHLNQDVRTTASPAFAALTLTSGVRSSTSVTFSTNGTTPQNVITAGVVASGTMSSISDLPTNGIYSQGVIKSGVSTGTAPFIIGSTTPVPNLNVDMVDGYHLNQNVQTTGSPSFAALTVNGKVTAAGSAGRQFAAQMWADVSSNSSGFALFSNNAYYDWSSSALKYSNTHASLGARGIIIRAGADPVYFDSGNATATTADATFSPSTWQLLHTGNAKGNMISAPRSDQTFDLETAKEIRWRNYGSGHTIVDASSGNINGFAKSNRDPESPWQSSYPTLVGFNGSNTFGVRVDSARVADKAANITTSTAAPSGGVDGDIWIQY